MDWIRISEKLPAIGQQVFLCDETDTIGMFIHEGALSKNVYYEDDMNEEERYKFDGDGWFGPLTTSNFTHWMPKYIPKHVLI